MIDADVKYSHSTALLIVESMARLWHEVLYLDRSEFSRSCGKTLLSSPDYPLRYPLPLAFCNRNDLKEAISKSGQRSGKKSGPLIILCYIDVRPSAAPQ